MKTMKRLLLALVLLVLCCTLAACQKKAEPADAANTQTPMENTASANGNPDDVMLTMGDFTLTRAKYESYLKTLTDYYTNYGFDMTDEGMVNSLKGFALQTGIEYGVMDLKLAELGLTLTEAEKEEVIANARVEWESVVEEGLAYYGLTAESTEEERNNLTVSVLAELESMGYTAEAYIEDAVTLAGYDRIYEYASKDAAVSQEEVVAYYNSLVEADKAAYENDAAAYEQAEYMNQMYVMYGMTDYAVPIYYKPAGYRQVTHILLEVDEELLTAYTDLQAAYEEQQLAKEEGTEVTGEEVTADEIENARLAILASVQPKVDEINQRLDGGESFAALIPEYTSDPGMNTAETVAIGYEVHMDSVNWATEFRDQAFTVSNIGDVTAPVVSDYGVHILQYVGDVPGGPVELTEEMEASFTTMLLSSKRDEMYYDTLQKWVEAIDVVYSEEAKAILADAEAANAAAAVEGEAAE